MFKSAAVLFLYAESPVHAGTGASVGSVDLPIQREKHTEYPIMQSSGVKGAIRAFAEKLPESDRLAGDEPRDWDQKIDAVFGPSTSDAEKKLHGSAVAFTDARVLLFPVRSLAGVFAWITCPGVIERFRRHLELVSTDGSQESSAGVEQLVHGGCIPRNLRVRQGQAHLGRSETNLKAGGRLVLEDFDFEVVPDEKVSLLARWLARNAIPCAKHYDIWKEKLETDLVVLDDESFRDFVRFSTQVSTRIELDDETRTVSQGPWDEEALPAETLLYSFALVQDPQQPRRERRWDAPWVLDFLEGPLFRDMPIIQFGGNQTIGYGLVRTNFRRRGALLPVATEGEAAEPACEQEEV